MKNKLNERRTVQIQFSDDEEAIEFKKEMDQRFGIDRSNKYCVPKGTGTRGAVFVESEIFEKILKEQELHLQKTGNLYLTASGNSTQGNLNFETGREVMRQFVAHGATMNVRSLAPGMYHVIVRDKNHMDIRQFNK